MAPAPGLDTLFTSLAFAPLKLLFARTGRGGRLELGREEAVGVQEPVVAEVKAGCARLISVSKRRANDAEALVTEIPNTRLYWSNDYQIYCRRRVCISCIYRVCTSCVAYRVYIVCVHRVWVWGGVSH
jgi:hypothetical protein